MHVTTRVSSGIPALHASGESPIPAYRSHSPHSGCGSAHEKESCTAGFSACGGSHKRHNSFPSQYNPPKVFIFRRQCFLKIKKPAHGEPVPVRHAHHPLHIRRKTDSSPSATTQMTVIKLFALCPGEPDLRLPSPSAFFPFVPRPLRLPHPENYS